KLVYVANAGDDTVSVVGTSLDAKTASFEPTQLRVLGALPTAWYPTAVTALPAPQGLIVASAKGYGGVPVVRGSPYDGNTMVGTIQPFSPPPSKTLPASTSTARQALLWGTRANSLRNAGNPIPPSATGGPSPIKHVVLVVRENRTFDQVFGDLPALGWS